MFEIVQVVPQPQPDEYAAIIAALTRLAAPLRTADADIAAAPLRYQEVTRASIIERPRNWSAAARLEALHV